MAGVGYEKPVSKNMLSHLTNARAITDRKVSEHGVQNNPYNIFSYIDITVYLAYSVQ